MTRIETIIQGYRSYSNDVDAVEKIQQAYQIAWNAHAGQFRRSGEPFIVHPLSVAQILVDLKMDSSCICAALLHDTIEDTDVTFDSIEGILGREIAGMVDALTSIKTSALAKKIPKEQERADTMRKIVLGTAKNVRVIIVKLADRWNNMQTLQYMSVEKRKKIALETMSIYAPIADRLGLSVIRRDLEDLSFSFIDPKSHQKYQRRLAKSKSFLESDIGELKQKAADALERYGLKVTLYERYKTPYSLFQRDQQNLPAHFLYINIITESDLSCYQALGVFHENFRPLPGTTIRDYIAVPRSNGYQALHTTILFKEHVYPIQIRSSKMERIAMYGILQSGQESSRSRYGTWIKRLGEFVQDEKDASYLIKGIEDLAAQDKIYVCTPQGDYLGFPRDASVLDFAYRIHTDIGHRCQGALIDERPSSIFDKLVDGAMVEIILADTYQIRPDWLQHAKTQRSRTAIRAWMESQKRLRSMEFGKRIFGLELERNSINIENFLNENRFESVLKNLGVTDQDDLYLKIGSGTLTLKTVMKSILDDEAFARFSSRGTSQVSRLLNHVFSRTKQDDMFEITDIHDPYLKFSPCCNPMPGEDVVGILSYEHGLSVHRHDCQAIKSQNDEDQQIFKLVWNTEKIKPFPETFQITCSNRKGLVGIILKKIESHAISLNDFHMHCKNNTCHIQFEVMSQSTHYSQSISRMLDSIHGVSKVVRIPKDSKGKQPE